MQKIQYTTERNGELKEFPLNNQYIVLPNGLEFAIRYDHIREGLTITKITEGELWMQPHVSNQILIK